MRNGNIKTYYKRRATEGLYCTHIHFSAPKLLQHDFYGLLLKQFLHVCICVSLTAVMVPFVDIANRVSSSHHDVILSDAVSHCPYVQSTMIMFLFKMSVTLLSRDTILHTLECHLKNNIVKVGEEEEGRRERKIL